MTDKELEALLLLAGWRAVYVKRGAPIDEHEWTGSRDTEAPTFEDIRRLVSFIENYIDKPHRKESNMARNLSEYLDNWRAALNEQIGDTQEEIQKRREACHEAVEARTDLVKLQAYINSHKLPPRVRSALERCMQWNPWATRKELK